MPIRVFDGEGDSRALFYKCKTCRRLHETHADAVACEHGHVNMIAYEHHYEELDARYPVEIHMMFADGNIVIYKT